MSAFNVVRFRVRPGEEQRFIDEHHKMRANLKGFVAGALIRTGDRTFCFVGEWRNFESIVAARPQMVVILDGLRSMLEELGGDLGVTDPVSGEVVARVTATRTAKRKRRSGLRRKSKTKRTAVKRKR